MGVRLQNPLLPGFYPDPSVCRVEDDYYMFAIVDGVVYDKNQRYLDMQVITIYKLVDANKQNHVYNFYNLYKI